MDALPYLNGPFNVVARSLPVEIVGKRDCGERSVRLPDQGRAEQAEDHLRIGQGKGVAEPHSAREFEHAIIRAAVAFPLD